MGIFIDDCCQRSFLFVIVVLSSDGLGVELLRSVVVTNLYLTLKVVHEST